MLKCRGQDYFLEGNKGEKNNEHRITFAPNSCSII